MVTGTVQLHFGAGFRRVWRRSSAIGGCPATTLYLDLFQSAGDHTQLKQVIAELHALQFKVIATIPPGIEISAAEGIERELLLRYPDGEPLVRGDLARRVLLP